MVGDPLPSDKFLLQRSAGKNWMERSTPVSWLLFPCCDKTPSSRKLGLGCSEGSWVQGSRTKARMRRSELRAPGPTRTRRDAGQPQSPFPVTSPPKRSSLLILPNRPTNWEPGLRHSSPRGPFTQRRGCSRCS